MQRPSRSVSQLRKLKSDIDVKVARGVAVTDHTRHQRHFGIGEVGGPVVVGSRVSKIGFRDNKFIRGNYPDGYSWALLRFLAKEGYLESESESDSESSIS